MCWSFHPSAPLWPLFTKKNQNKKACIFMERSLYRVLKSRRNLTCAVSQCSILNVKVKLFCWGFISAEQPISTKKKKMSSLKSHPSKLVCTSDLKTDRMRGEISPDNTTKVQLSWVDALEQSELDDEELTAFTQHICSHASKQSMI